MSLEEWNELVADPERLPDEDCGCSAKKPTDPETPSLTFQKRTSLPVDEAYSALLRTPRDLNEHMPVLRKLAGSVTSVTEFSHRRESTVAFLAGLLDHGGTVSLHSYNQEKEGLVKATLAWVGEALEADRVAYTYSSERPPTVPAIDATDLLFLDDDHRKKPVLDSLELYHSSVSRYIVLHDTQIYGEVGPDSGPGILPAVREFIKAHPEWSVISHYAHQFGLTVLGKLPEDKPKLPSVFTMAKNFVEAQAKYVASGMEHCTLEEYSQRLETCSICPHRNDDRCSVCGCFIEAKAKQKVSVCPIGKWETPSLDTPEKE